MGPRGGEALPGIALKMLSILATVAAVSLLIVVHEFGHLIGAKLVGMRVEVFSFGFWKRLIGFRAGETDYRVSLIPVGGYIKVSGEGAEEGAGEPHEFWSKTPGQRAVFVVGGVVMSFVLAAVLFVLAFAVGVQFVVAEVGSVTRGSAAWAAGIRPGDEIVSVDGMTDPVFNDITSAVAVGGGETVAFGVRRDGQELAFSLRPEYDEQVGLRLVGIQPPVEPVVTGVQRVGGPDGRSPAAEAGVQVGDRVLSVNGRPVATAQAFERELLNSEDVRVELVVERDGEELPLTVETEPRSRHIIGISGATTTVEAVQQGGPAWRAGLRAGDTIAAVGDRPVRGFPDLQEAIEASPRTVTLQVERDGQAQTLSTDAPDAAALEGLLDGIAFTDSATLPWVEPDGPAWAAGMRPGDTLVSVNGEPVESWLDILAAVGGAGRGPYSLEWLRDDERLSASVEPVERTEPGPGPLGIGMDRLKTVRTRFGVLGALKRGTADTFRQLGQIALTLKGFATRAVSPRHMHGIVTIAYVSYRAAQEGVGQLLYLTAMISTALAFFNILPIPVLDGGHLLFLAIEKVRGRRVGERVMFLAQAVGFAFLIALLVYITRNDVLGLLRQFSLL